MLLPHEFASSSKAAQGTNVCQLMQKPNLYWLSTDMETETTFATLWYGNWNHTAYYVIWKLKLYLLLSHTESAMMLV